MSKMKHLLRKLHIHHHHRVDPPPPPPPLPPSSAASSSSPSDSALTARTREPAAAENPADFNFFEEEFQVQLALAISVSDPDSRDDPETAQIKAAKQISLGCAPSETLVESLSLRYWSFNFVNYDEKVMDGFYDVYGISSNSGVQGNMPLLLDLQAITVSDKVDYEVILVNRAIDPALRELEERVYAISVEQRDSEQGCISGLIQRIADLVVDRMGGQVSDADEMLRRWTLRGYELRKSLKSIILPLGCLDVGLSRHRALLFKVLADTISLPCMLVKGSYYTGTDEGAVNLIKFDSGSEYIIDLMGAPGTLIPAELPSDHLQNSGLDRRSGSDYAETVKILCPVLEKQIEPVTFSPNVGQVAKDGSSDLAEASFSGIQTKGNGKNVEEKNRTEKFENEFGKLLPSLRRSNEGLSGTCGKASDAQKMKVKDVSKYVISASKNPDFAQKLHAVLLENIPSPPPHSVLSEKVTSPRLILDKKFHELRDAQMPEEIHLLNCEKVADGAQNCADVPEKLELASNAANFGQSFPSDTTTSEGFVLVNCGTNEVNQTGDVSLGLFPVDSPGIFVRALHGVQSQESSMPSATDCFEGQSKVVFSGDGGRYVGDKVGRVLNNFEREREFTYNDLLLIIIAQLPIGVVKDVELMDRAQLTDMLFQFFMEVKFLMVLDNVPGVDICHKLLRPFADIANGSRVMLTTRNADVASQADPWSYPVRLERLNERDSWVLFMNKVKVGTPEDNLSDHLNSFRVKILTICRGSPPAIVLLGGLLSRLSERSSVIDHLSHLCGDDDHSVPLPSILALCYRKLPFVLRPCFLYLALFPKMYEIPIRRLLHLWLAEGFVQTSTEATSEVPEDVAQIYVKELVCRNMIEIARRNLDGSPKTCRLPCFLHDVFLSQSEDIGFLHVHHRNSDCKSPHSPNFVIRRLADQYFGIRSTSDSHTQKLYSYLLFETQKHNTPNKEIETLLKRIMYRRNVALLKVIDLESIYRPVLPDNLGELQNLTYIGLRWTGLYSCPTSIGDLPCLETLDVKYTNITTLPSSIWKAKKLRHLYMNEVSIEKTSKEPSTHLQTLVGLQIGSKDPDEYGLTRLTSLRKLRLTCHSKALKRTIDCVSGLVKLQTLKLRSRDPFGQPLDIVLSDERLKVHQSLVSLSLFGVIKGGTANLPQNLKTLALSMSKLEEDQMQLLGKLQKLNILVLLARSYSGNKMEYCRGTFPELHVLKLWKLENLEELGVEEGGLPKLEEMEIRGCEKLKKFEGSEHLGALKELVLTNMPKDLVEAVGEKSVKEKLVMNEWRVHEKVNERAASSSSLV